MEFIRIARNPWGEEILVGLAWDVLWLVVVLGALFIVGHWFFARGGEKAEVPARDRGLAGRLPEKVSRHGKSARISHWILAAATLTLVVTAFVPILGLQFPWVTIHWIAGIVFGAYVIYHTVDAVVRGSLGTMWIGVREMGQALGRTKDFFSGRDDPEKRPGKWGTENKVFHHITALAGLVVLVTGVVMMLRIDTWFWAADPYALEWADATWGWIFLLHGVAAVGFVGLLMAHIYFAVRPDKWWITRSMFKGWITREEYLAHHDPERWSVTTNGDRSTPSAPAERPTVAAGAPTAPSASDPSRN